MGLGCGFIKIKGTRGMLQNLPGALGVTSQEANRTMLSFLVFVPQAFNIMNAAMSPVSGHPHTLSGMISPCRWVITGHVAFGVREV